MSAPLMSVIMPVFNASRYLDRALQSVLMQGIESLELICVDDGSSDDSGEILKGWAARDKRVRLLKQENAGQGAARNRALDHASGDWVVFVDADDQLLPGALKQMLAHASDSSVLVYSFLNFKTDNDLLRVQAENSGQTTVVPREALLGMMGVVWNKFVRRKWLNDAHVKFPEGMIYEDIPVHWKLVLLPERIRYLPAALYALRSHASSTTAAAVVRRLDSVKAFRIVEEFLRTSGKWHEYGDVFMECQLRNLAQVYDALAEHGAEPMARAAIEGNMRADQRNALTRLPMHWRDRDVLLALQGNRFASARRHAFMHFRKAYRTFRRFLAVQA